MNNTGRTTLALLAALESEPGSLLCLCFGRVRRHENGLPIRRNGSLRCCAAEAAGRSDSNKTRYPKGKKRSRRF